MQWYEIIGYVGSFLIAVSLTMKNIWKLRKINLLGAATFATYGAIIGAYPVLILNSFISLVDIYYLWGMYRKKDYFTLLPTNGPQGKYLLKFLDYYRNDIASIFPKFKKEDHPDAQFYFILRNMIPTGLFVYTEEDPETIHIILDYAIPDYRDLKNAKFLYFTADFMKEKGYKKLITESHHQIHEKYLKALGFERVDDKTFLKTLDQ